MMEFFRSVFFSFAAWLVFTGALGLVSFTLLVPNIPDPEVKNTTVECLSVKQTDKVDKDTGYITFDCIKVK